MNGNGITVQEFMMECDNLYNNISKRRQEVQSGITDHKMTEFGILSVAQTIIDRSHGFIQTENEEVKSSFSEVFETARQIVQKSRESSHYEAEIRRAKNADDGKAMEENKKFKEMADKMYLGALKRAITAVAKAKTIEMGMQI